MIALDSNFEVKNLGTTFNPLVNLNNVNVRNRMFSILGYNNTNPTVKEEEIIDRTKMEKKRIMHRTVLIAADKVFICGG